MFVSFIVINSEYIPLCVYPDDELLGDIIMIHEFTKHVSLIKVAFVYSRFKAPDIKFKQRNLEYISIFKAVLGET